MASKIFTVSFTAVYSRLQPVPTPPLTACLHLWKSWMQPGARSSCSRIYAIVLRCSLAEIMAPTARAGAVECPSRHR